jgi:hypothetical protein
MIGLDPLGEDFAERSWVVSGGSGDSDPSSIAVALFVHLDLNRPSEVRGYWPPLAAGEPKGRPEELFGAKTMIEGSD